MKLEIAKNKAIPLTIVMNSRIMNEFPNNDTCNLTFEAYAKEGRALRATADIVSQTNQAHSPGKPEKKIQLLMAAKGTAAHKEKGEKVLRRSKFRARGGAFGQVDVAFTVAQVPWLQTHILCD